MLKAYYDLTKFGAVAMIMGVSALGYLQVDPFAPRGLTDTWHFIQTLLYIGLASAGALALNQYWERDRDAVMKRTEDRPIPSGRVSPESALVFGLILLFLGLGLLAAFVGLACALATGLCGFLYVLVYTPLKHRTTYSTFIGALPGALLPIMGALALSDNYLSHVTISMGVLLFVWQIPHALIIALRHQADYEEAGMKQLPLVNGEAITRRQILWYTLLILPISLFAFLAQQAGYYAGGVALISGLVLIVLAVSDYLAPTPKKARQFFIAMLVQLPLVLLLVVIDKIR